MRFLTLFILLPFPALAPGGPATQPAAEDPLVSSACEAISSGKLEEFARGLEDELRALLADPAKADLARLTRLASFRELGRYFARLEKTEDQSTETLLWLARQERLLPVLMMAVGDADAPDRVLEVLTALVHEHEPRLAELSDLTAALCVVWDAPTQVDPDNPRADAERAVWLFRYFSRARATLRFDPAQLPWELAVWVVDNPLSEEEIAWAVKRYRGRGAIGAVYFDVPYDWNAFAGSADRAIDSTDYTLMNLVRHGGIRGDQAYFATHVARALGTPACTVSGLGGSAQAMGHAWVGYLDTRGRSVAWNFSEGRYPEHQYWKGEVSEPQTRGLITESDVAILSELARCKPADRLASAALCKSADLLAPEERAKLYTHAINLSPGNRLAWMSLAKLGYDRALSDAQLAEADAVVSRFAAKSYPDFAFNILLTLHGGRGTQQRLAALRQQRDLFRTRPDLLAELRMIEGDLLRQQQKHAAALSAYGEVLERYGNAGPIVMSALERIDALLRENNDLKRLAGIYRHSWQKMPLPPVSGIPRASPYYLVGQRYLELLEELNDKAESARVRARLDSLTATPR